MLLLFGIAVWVHGQTTGFEVTSIKPNRSGAGGSSIRGSNGRVTMENVPLRKLALWAYGIPDDREYALVGPDWMGSEHFDIQATFPAQASAAAVREMAQGMLAERFKLALHRETRQLPMYALAVAKNGPKIHPVEAGQGRTSGGRGRLEAHAISMQKLADLLARMIGVPVSDATGLAGVFNFTLEWSPDELQKAPPAEDAAAANTGPSLFTALQEQLGLKLEGRKGAVEVLVVELKCVERFASEHTARLPAAITPTFSNLMGARA